MDKITLIVLIAFFSLMLFMLVLLYLRSGRRKASAKPAQTSSGSAPMTFEQIVRVFHNRESTHAQLDSAVKALLERYGKIHGSGGRSFTAYSELFVALCKHPRVDTQLVLTLDRGLHANNPQHKSDLDALLKYALEQRGSE